MEFEEIVEYKLFPLKGRTDSSHLQGLWQIQGQPGLPHTKETNLLYVIICLLYEVQERPQYSDEVTCEEKTCLKREI